MCYVLPTDFAIDPILFDHQLMHVQWQGKPEVTIAIALRVIQDHNSQFSDNLKFELKHIRLFGISLPIGWLQPFVDDFNPLFKLDGFPGKIIFGKIRMENGSILIGSDDEK